MTYSDKKLRKWLLTVKTTQSAIEKLTKWVIHYRKHYKEVCLAWHDVVFTLKSDPARILNIIYVINHTIQECRKVNQSLAEKFTVHLAEVFEMFGRNPQLNSKITQKVLKVFEVWKHRRVLPPVKVAHYEETFLKAREGIEQTQLSQTTESSSTKKPHSSNTPPADGTRKRQKSGASSAERRAAKGRRKRQSSGAPSSSGSAPLVNGQANGGTTPVLDYGFEVTHAISEDQKKRFESQAIFQAAMRENSIYEETEWLDNVDQEILGFNDEYLDRHLVEMQRIPGMGAKSTPNAKVFTERMTKLLKAPSSLDSKARTELTKLPSELSDPSKMDQMIENGLMEGDMKSERRMQLKENMRRVQNSGEQFKKMLDDYNARLDGELIERRELGNTHMLVEFQRKKTHTSYLEKFKQVAGREDKVSSNLDKINAHYDAMPKSPKLDLMNGMDDDEDDLLPDIKDLFADTAEIKIS